MAKKSTTAKISVAIRMRAVPILSPSFPRRGAEISAETPGTAAIMPLRKAILLLSGSIDLINSARIGPTEPLQSWITMVVTNRLITSPGYGSEAKTALPLRRSDLLITGRPPSLIRKSVTRKLITSRIAVMMNTARRPTWSARKPPSSGPPITPLIWAVESVLSAQPLRSRGT